MKPDKKRAQGDVPTGSATKRGFRMAAMTAGVTGSYLGYLAQSAFLDEEGRAKKLSATHSKAAKRLTEGLAGLRGPAMKLGQALSLQEGMLPDETLAELASLQMSAPAMHGSLVRAQFKSSLGRSPEEVFRTFDPEPFAAASLGQVHHAVTKKGETVVVKIQYPGIREAIAGDFRWFRALNKGSQMQRLIAEPLVAELEVQIMAETDYVREADDIDFFRDRLSDTDWVTVPRVWRDSSSDRVLTMSLVPGEHLEQYLARNPSQKERDLLGERMLDLFYRQVLSFGAFHCDPHWGNYLFSPGAHIGLIDFGAVKRLDPAFVANLRAIFLYPGERDGPEFKALMEARYAPAGVKITKQSLAALVRFSKEFYGRVYPPEPERDATPIDFADVEILRLYMQHSHDLIHSKAGLPDYVMLGRAETGLYQTLYRLKARVHTSRIVRRYLGGV
jgi:predicted unusual protein kinase regulating ubiquinone biosynthesis (AarF/ABC1/UbiB family)